MDKDLFFTRDEIYSNRPNAEEKLIKDIENIKANGIPDNQARQGVADLNEQVNEQDSKIDVLQRNEISVLEFGAKGDGVTDDTQAIKNAITESRNKRMPVKIPAGSYKITSTIDLQKYDIVRGAGMDKTRLVCHTNGMIAVSIVTGELELTDIGFSRKDNTISYTAVQIYSSSMAKITNIVAYDANKVISIKSGGVGVYNSTIENVYGWLVNYGLYCEEGCIFNANRIKFRSLQGSGFYNTEKYKVGDVGVVLRGDLNVISGGEIASFETGVENFGTNNKLDNVYIERTNYSVKNSIKSIFNVISCSFGRPVYPVNAELVLTETGLGVTSLGKDVGVSGANIYNSMVGYYIFDDVYNTNSIYDYSGSRNHLTFNPTYLSFTDYQTSFGKVKKATFSQFGNLKSPIKVDRTKAYTFIWSAKTINSASNSFRALGINIGKTSYVRLDQQKNTVAVNYSNGTFQFLYNIGSGVSFESEGVWAIVIDFPNNKILQVDMYNAIVKEVTVDLSGIPDGSEIWFFHHSNGDTVTHEYAINYIAAWDRYLPLSNILEFMKIKRHVPRLETIRELENKLSSLEQRISALEGGTSA
jgi:hypothetical protein